MKEEFIEKMNKENRQAFFYLEKLIQSNKIELITMINNFPKINSRYDDKLIKNQIEEINKKIEKINTELNYTRPILAELVDWLNYIREWSEKNK